MNFCSILCRSVFYVDLTKVKLLNIISFFAIFDPNLALTSLKIGISSYNCHKFPCRWFYNHCFLLLNNPQVKYEKNLMLLPVPLLFSQHWISQVFNIMLPLQSLVLLKEHPDLNYTMKLG